MRGYRFLEHTSDVYVEAYGKSLEEAFEEAAKALTDTIVDITKIDLQLEENIKVSGVDLEDLLVRWLNELLYKFDAENKVFAEFKVKSLDKTRCTLEAIAKGELYNPDKHDFKVEVKSVTYGMLSIEESPEITKIRVLFDI